MKSFKDWKEETEKTHDTIGDFIQASSLVNKNYGVQGIITGDNENKLLILTHGNSTYIIKINLKSINTTALWFVMKEYIELFQLCFVSCNIVIKKEYEGQCFTFIK